MRPIARLNRGLMVMIVTLVSAVGIYVVGPGRAATVSGDVNLDGKVDVFDLSKMLTVWGTNTPAADFDANGTVNIFDLSLLLSNWGKTGPTPTPTATATTTPVTSASPTPEVLGACTVSTATGAGSPTRVVNVAAPSGDMTTAIRNALSSASGGGKVVLQAGTYTITGTLTVPSGVRLTGAGMGTTVIKASDTTNVNPMVAVPGSSSNVTVENLTINQNGGSAASRQSLSAYLIETRGTNTIFQKVATRSPSTYSMVAVGANRFCFRNNNVLQDPSYNGKYNQLDGIHVLNASNGDVINNYVDQQFGGATNGDDALVAHTIGEPVRSVLYKGNVVRGGSHGTAIAVWNHNDNIENITITENEIWGYGRIGHGDGYGGNQGSFNTSRITNNIIHNVGGNGISIAGTGLTETGNKLCSAGNVSVTGSGNTVNSNTGYTGCTAVPSTQNPPPSL